MPAPAKKTPTQAEVLAEEHQHDMMQRVGALESDVRHLSDAVAGLSHKFDALSSGLYAKLDAIVVGNNEKFQSLSQKNQITMPLIIGVISVLLTITGLISGGGWVIHSMSLQPLALVGEHNNTRIEKLEKATYNADAADEISILRTTVEDAKLSRLEDRIAVLDKRLEEHVSEAGHPWDVLQKVNDIENRLNSGQAATETILQSIQKELDRVAQELP